jgi:nucleotide-binding universal stress UspA family protein
MKWFKGKRVLVPFDYSDESVEAVKVALALAESRDDVHVLHVLIELPASDPVVIWDEMNDEKRMTAARASMEEKLAESDIRGVQLDTRIGNPAIVIADLAEEVEAGVIIIPSHGYTGVKRFFLGSVAERVVRLAKCPVLVLKGG